MKRQILVTLLFVLFAAPGKAQIYDLVSQLDGWENTINKCDRLNNCPTYEYLCVTGTGCSNWWVAPTWGRIGTPSQPSQGYVFMHSSSGSVEGLFTNFNWIPGERYYIHLGISSFSMHNNLGPISQASIKLLATQQVQQTNGQVCCSEASLWDYSTNNMRNTANVNLNGTDYWSDNNGQYNPNVEGMEIGEIRPNNLWAGQTKDYLVTFTPTAGTSFNQFALYAYYDYLGYQVNAVLDYIIIERDCGAAFSYTRHTNNPSQVDFFAMNPQPGTYNWSFGDGAIGSGPNVTHTYGGGPTGTGSYTVCLNLDNPEGDCDNCEDICVTSIGRQATCDIISDFQLDVRLKDRTVIVTPTSSFSSYVIDWGDGTSTNPSSAPASHIHEYATPGNYVVCMTAYGEEEGCWARTCVNVCLPEFNGSGVSEEQTGQVTTGGKSSPTDVSEIAAVITSADNITISPNPVTSVASITLFADEPGTSGVNVYDVSGRRVLNFIYNHHIGDNKLPVNMDGLQKGLYIIELKTGDIVSRSKIVKE